MCVRFVHIPINEYIESDFFPFRPEWIEQMETHQSNILPIDLIKSQKNWFEYLPNEADPTISRYRCRLCAKYSDEFGSSSRIENEFALKGGMLKSSKQDNEDAIKEHTFTSEHRNIIQILEERKLREMENDFKRIEAVEEAADDNNLQVTARMFRTVYVEVKKNILFEAHPDLLVFKLRMELIWAFTTWQEETQWTL